MNKLTLLPAAFAMGATILCSGCSTQGRANFKRDMDALAAQPRSNPVYIYQQAQQPAFQPIPCAACAQEQQWRDLQRQNQPINVRIVK